MNLFLGFVAVIATAAALTTGFDLLFVCVVAPLGGLCATLPVRNTGIAMTSATIPAVDAAVVAVPEASHCNIAEPISQTIPASCAEGA